MDPTRSVSLPELYPMLIADSAHNDLSHEETNIHVQAGQENNEKWQVEDEVSNYNNYEEEKSIADSSKDSGTDYKLNDIKRDKINSNLNNEYDMGEGLHDQVITKEKMNVDSLELQNSMDVNGSSEGGDKHATDYDEFEMQEYSEESEDDLDTHKTYDSDKEVNESELIIGIKKYENVFQEKGQLPVITESEREIQEDEYSIKENNEIHLNDVENKSDENDGNEKQCIDDAENHHSYTNQTNVTSGEQNSEITESLAENVTGFQVCNTEYPEQEGRWFLYIQNEEEEFKDDFLNWGEELEEECYDVEDKTLISVDDAEKRIDKLFTELNKLSMEIVVEKELWNKDILEHNAHEEKVRKELEIENDLYKTKCPDFIYDECEKTQMQIELEAEKELWRRQFLNCTKHEEPQDECFNVRRTKSKTFD